MKMQKSNITRPRRVEDEVGKSQSDNWKKLLFSLAIVVGIMAVGILGISVAKAEDSEQVPPIIQRLVERFGLNEDEVKAVFNEVREEHRANRETRFEERLTQAVADGELTEEQKQLILAKHEELRAGKEADWESMKDMTPEERHQAMQDRRAELEAWAEENGIEMDFLCGEFGHHGGPGGPGKFGGGW